MDDELLIEEVRQYEEMYNMAHKKYSDNQHKDLIWAKIGEKLKISGPVCKSRWVSLRDQLRKALKNKKTKSGQAAVVQKKWKYEDSMNFLILFFKERETHSNIAPPDGVGVSEESNDEDISQVNNEESEIEITQKRSIKQTKVFPKKKNKTETASSVLMQYLLDSENNESKETTHAHPIDSFFHGLAATVKTFSPEYQFMAKSKLFSIVSDLEWEQLQNNQMTPSTNYLTSDLGSNSSTTSVTRSQNSLSYYGNRLRTPLNNSSSLNVQTPTPSTISELATSPPQSTQHGIINNQRQQSTSFLTSTSLQGNQNSLPYDNRMRTPLYTTHHHYTFRHQLQLLFLK